ncbi:MAG: 16S rRNA (cytosine(967)-C(5))-methyltransferase RsmB [Defluviitaleaceae bacterium]|nr:16S rRNA (cytosine(967)-C(5))-methyltransferase RsmB [Defluviitaleaceae bacterium]
MANISQERKLALQALEEVMNSGGYSNIVLNKLFTTHTDLPRERRAFVTECVNGSLRRLHTLDYIINQVANTNTRGMDAFVLNLLRISVYQLAYMKNAAEHAIVDEAVKIVESSKFLHLKGFVNACLRGIIRDLHKIVAGIDEIRESNPLAWLSVKESCPKPVLEVLVRELGFDETALLLSHANSFRPPVTACVNTLKTTASELARKLAMHGAVVEKGSSPFSLNLRGLPGIQNLPAYRDGLFHIMDEGAMVAVDAAGLKPGQRVLDICAAPGGKAFYAAMVMSGIGHIEARDIHEHKIDLINAGLRRLGISNISAKTADATLFDAGLENSFDVVMADVPCTGLGLIGKKPEIRYRFNMAQVSKLQGLQRRILNNCVRYVKPGGTLLYSTCTLTSEENRKNAAWLTKEHGLTQVSERLLLPHITKSDGFYVAAFEK